MVLGNKRGVFVDISGYNKAGYALNAQEFEALTKLDVAYRTLVALLYNYVPTSGHPGGSISSGRVVAHLLYSGLLYNFSNVNAIIRNLRKPSLSV